MQKKYHKIWFWLTVGAFILTLTVLYIFFVSKISAQSTLPTGVSINGDSVFSNEVTAGGSSFSSSSIDINALSKDVNNKAQELIGKSNVKTFSDINSVFSGGINPDNLPEGQIWRYTGTANIEINDSFAISGKGTIVIIGANLTITNGLTYATTGDNSIGFIVIDSGGQGGTITIDKDVNSLVGAFYASNQIVFRYRQ